MTNLFVSIFSLEFLKYLIPVIVAVLAWLLNEHSKRKWELWQIKREACLRALNIANAVLSNHNYSNIKKEEIKPQFESIENIRACFNELACTCDGPDVLNGLKKIMFESVTPAEIVNLRTAVRKELGIKGGAIDVDTNKAFLGQVNCEPRD